MENNKQYKLLFYIALIALFILLCKHCNTITNKPEQVETGREMMRISSH